MVPRRFDRLVAQFGARLVTTIPRRALARGAAALATAGLAAAGFPGTASPKKRKRRKKCRNCCLAEGSACKKKKATCRPENCLRAPLTIEAHWTNSSSDHDTWLFVPNEAGAALPFPYIRFNCNPGTTGCEGDVYPFACVNQNATGPGDEVTTVRRLIAGRYEYWIELEAPSPTADLTVTLRNQGGRLVRSWTSPRNVNPAEPLAWHVFDLDGGTGRVTSVDEVVFTIEEAHDPSYNVCPPS